MTLTAEHADVLTWAAEHADVLTLIAEHADALTLTGEHVEFGSQFGGWLCFWQSRDGSMGAKPSLQALRAETMVERFTARMHVYLRSDFFGLKVVVGGQFSVVPACVLVLVGWSALRRIEVEPWVC